MAGGMGAALGTWFAWRNAAPAWQQWRFARATWRMQRHVTRAAREVDARGNAALTPPQRDAAARSPRLRPMFRGNRIDVMARQAIMNDPAIKKLDLQSNYTNGPDFVHPATGRWWDMTTPAQWQAHVNKYGEGGTLLSTEAGILNAAWNFVTSLFGSG